MKTLIEAAQEYAESQGYDTCDYVTKKDFEEYARIDFYAGVEFAQRWIPVEEELPAIHDDVLVRCRNKNKEDGIWLYDVCEIDDETNTWNKKMRNNWETVTHWRRIEIE